MATEFKPKDNSDEKTQQLGTRVTPVSTQQVGVSGTPTAGTSGGMAPQATSSGRFVNLQSYLKANQPKAGQQGMAQAVAGGVEKKGEEFKGQLEESKKQLTGGADAFKKQMQEMGSQYAGQIQQDPTKISAEQFAQARDARYTGPQQLANLSQLSSQAQNLQQLGGLVGSEAGRRQLLTQTFQAPGYTRGLSSLDQALLQSNPQQLAKLKAVQSITNRAAQNLAGAQQTAGQSVQSAQQQAQATQQQVRGALDTAALGLQSELQKQADVNTPGTVAYERQRAYNAAAERLASGNLLPEDLRTLGLKTGDILYNVDLKNLSGLAQGQQVTEQNVANAEQQAKIAALGKLAGGTGFLSDPEKAQQISQFYAQQYGGLEKDPYKFSENAAERVKGAISSAKASYDQEIQSSPHKVGYDQAQGALAGDTYYTGRGGLRGALSELREAVDTGNLSAVQRINDQMRFLPGFKRGQYINGMSHARNLLDKLQNQVNFEESKLNIANQGLEPIRQKYGVGRTVKQGSELISSRPMDQSSVSVR